MNSGNRSVLFGMVFLGTVSFLVHAGDLTILHTNDMHARVVGVRSNDTMCSLIDRDGTDCFGGFDRIYTQVQKERKEHGNVLLLDAGDQFQGSMYHSVYRGIASAGLMNRIGYDAMAVGNHEFDGGPKDLANFVDALKFPLLSANIDASKNAALKNKIKPYVVMQKNGLRIGILGYTTEDAATLSAPGPEVQFKEVILSVKRAVAALKNARVNVIVAISHSGLNKDIEVAKHVDGIAAIVCGHTNSLLSNTQKDADGPSPLVIMSPSNNPVLLVSAYAYGKFLGKLRFSFNKQGIPISWKAEPILLDSAVGRDEKIKAEIDKLYEPIAVLEKKQLGDLPVDVDGRQCRFEECLFGNLLADAMLDYTKNLGVQMALMNGGGIRSSLSKGSVNEAQLHEVLPFKKTLVLLKLTGKSIWEIVEHGLAFVEDAKNGNTGRFLQVSGIKYFFDPRKPKGKRVSQILVKNASSLHFEPLNMKRVYSVITNSYLVDGGDGFGPLLKSHEKWSIALELNELVSQFLSSPLSQLPSKDGRIVNMATAINLPLQTAKLR